MRWRGNRQSNNIEDKRGSRASGSRLGALGGGGGLMRLLPTVLRLLGWKGTLVVALGIGAYGLYTGNLGSLLEVSAPSPSSQTKTPVEQSEAEKELVQFVSVVLADTEDTWQTLFKQQNKTYAEPRLVLFRGAVNSACGLRQAAMGPFYCPADRKVYLDLSFFEELRSRFKAPGDFAQAYVVAHEVGHHVQTLLGISSQVQAAKQKSNEVAANRLSVKQELQADCFAGIWAFHANRSRQLLDSGDIEEGLTAASAIGDDRLQKQTRGHVTPDSFTHGSSTQRVRWFTIGWQNGEIKSCDTFSQNSVLNAG